MRSDWPVVPDDSETWTEAQIERMITMLRDRGHYNTPTAYYIAGMMEQLLYDNRQLRMKIDLMEARINAESRRMDDQ